MTADWLAPFFAQTPAPVPTAPEPAYVYEDAMDAIRAGVPVHIAFEPIMVAAEALAAHHEASRVRGSTNWRGIGYRGDAEERILARDEGIRADYDW